MDTEETTKAIFPFVENEFPTGNHKHEEIVGNEAKFLDSSVYVTPQKRFEAAYRKGNASGTFATPVFAFRSPKEKTNFVTIDTRVVFRVKELVYPGKDVIDIDGKWIYAFNVNAPKVLAEIWAEDVGKWWVTYNPTFSSDHLAPFPEIPCDGNLELPMIKANQVGTNVGFFISPFRLTSKAISFLTEKVDRLKGACVCAVRESAVGGLFAAVPDPYQWTFDAHEKYYIPLLDEWQHYIFDKKRQAEVFIASTLKAWILAKNEKSKNDDILQGGADFPVRGLHDNKGAENAKPDVPDSLDIQDELKPGEPDNYLSKYKSTEEKLRVRAEKAGAYLYNCVYAAEHEALDIAAIEAKDISLIIAMSNWAVLCERVIETAQGRLFATNLYKDPSRLPNQFLFQDNPPQPLLTRLEEYFPNTRFGWQAAISIVGDLMPAVFDKFKELNNAGATKTATDIINRQILTYLENLGIKSFATMKNPDKIPFLKAQGRSLYRQISEGKGLNSGIKKSVEDLYITLSNKFDHVGVKSLALKDAESLAYYQKLEKKVAWYDQSFLKENRVTIAVVFEVINLYNAIIAFNDSLQKKDGRLLKSISLLGSSADFTSAVAESLGKFFGKEVIFKRVGGIAGIVGGICQCIDEVSQSIEGAEQYDYGVVAGHGIAAAGAAMTAIGGAYILAEAMGVGAAGGPFGIAVGAIGAGLIISGNLLAAWLKDTPHEKFARFCFLGKQYETVANQAYELSERVNRYHPVNIAFNHLLGEKPYQRHPVLVEWNGEGGLPTEDNLEGRLKEARILMWLMSSFTLKSNRNIGSGLFEVTLIPGYFTPDATFDIKLEHTFERNEYAPSGGVIDGQEGTAMDHHEVTFTTSLTLDLDNRRLVYNGGNMIPSLETNLVKFDEFNNLESVKFSISPKRLHYMNKDLELSEFTNKKFSIAKSLVKVRKSMGRVYQPSASQYLVIEAIEGNTVISSDTSNWGVLTKGLRT